VRGNAKLVGVVVLVLLGLCAGVAPAAQDVSEIKVVVGAPLVVRGPEGAALDSPFHVIKLPDGSYRGFTANQTSYAIGGALPWAMGGPLKPTMQPPSPLHDQFDECGRWLNDTELNGATLIGFVHAEGFPGANTCSYEGILRSHASMALATSADYGTSWTHYGQIVTSPSPAVEGRYSGEGNCTVIRRGEYYYAYCLDIDRGYRTFVARAPISNPYPGSWRKYYGGSWNEPGLGGAATDLAPVSLGSAASVWNDTGAVVLLDMVDAAAFGGLKMSLADDLVSFSTVADPLVPVDGNQWSGRDSNSKELLAYPSAIDYADGDDHWSGSFILTYTWVPPGQTMNSRYLVMRNVYVSKAVGPQAVPVQIALTTWKSASGARRTSTAPIAAAGWSQEVAAGLVMTRARAGAQRLAECRNAAGDRLLSGAPAVECVQAKTGYVEERTVGWAWASPVAGTVPLWRCVNLAQQNHWASLQANCGGSGTAEFVLGYVGPP